MKAYAPNGLPIIGTLERIPGRANIVDDSFARDEHGTLVFDWTGETTVFWDGQETEENNGRAIYLDAKGGEWTEDQITLSEEEETEESPQ